MDACRPLVSQEAPPSKPLEAACASPVGPRYVERAVMDAPMSEAPSAGAETVDLARITTVIVNWETPDYTARAARALLEDGLPAEQIVIVDNGSKDGSYERLVQELPDCEVLGVPENIGYGRAMNLGARGRTADSYLLLNNDAFLHRPGSLRAMVRALESSGAGIVTPRVLNEDLTLQPTVAALQTPGVAFVRASGLSRLIPNRWQPSWSTHWNHDDSREIQAAAGVALLVRQHTWKQLGGFDERIYFLAEDLDICLRARQAGWKVWFASDAEFVHLGSGSTASRWTSPARAEMAARAEGTMIRRNLHPHSARLSLFFISGGLFARAGIYKVVGRQEASEATRAALRGVLARPTR
jgi:N-acetylglucosaminyl-diphospho-decaprenol L-rhamnosyltransferase